jgi:hypothetical protein
MNGSQECRKTGVSRTHPPADSVATVSANEIGPVAPMRTRAGYPLQPWKGEHRLHGHGSQIAF